MRDVVLVVAGMLGGNLVLACAACRAVRGIPEAMMARDEALMRMIVAAQDEARAFARTDVLLDQVSPDVAEEPPRPGLRLVD